MHVGAISKASEAFPWFLIALTLGNMQVRPRYSSRRNYGSDGPVGPDWGSPAHSPWYAMGKGAALGELGRPIA